MNIRDVFIFVSSTFVDMKAERDLMMYEVLPVLKKWGNNRGINFSLVDLRWGITDTQAKELHQTIQLCLQKVNESHPLFICFLGTRYGWSPEEEDFSSEFVKKDIKEAVEKKLSATSLEIMQALYNTFFPGLPKECLFFLRDEDPFIDLPERIKKLFYDKNFEKALKLRDQIKEENPNVTFSYQASFDTTREIKYATEEDGTDINYHPVGSLKINGNSLADFICEKVKAILEKDYPVQEGAENSFFNEYVLSSYRKSCPVPSIDDKLEALYVKESNKNIHGLFMKNGSGRSSALGRLYYRHQDDFIIYRNVSFDVNAYTYLSFARSLCEELKKRLDIKELVPFQYDEQIKYINNALKLVKDKKTVLIMDSLDSAVSLLEEWYFFFELLDFKKVFYTTNPLTKPTDLANNVDVEKISDEEIATILKTHLNKKAKNLEEEQLNKIVTSCDGDLSKAMDILFYLEKFTIHETLNKNIERLTNLPGPHVALFNYFELLRVQSDLYLPGALDSVFISLATRVRGMEYGDLASYLLYTHSREKPDVRSKDISDAIRFIMNFANDYIKEENGRLYLISSSINNAVIDSLYNDNTASKVFMYTALTTLLRVSIEDRNDYSLDDFINLTFALDYVDRNHFTMNFKKSNVFNNVFLYRLFKTCGIRFARKLIYKMIQDFREFEYQDDHVAHNPQIEFKQTLVRQHHQMVMTNNPPDELCLIYNFVCKVREEYFTDLKTFTSYMVDYINENPFTDTEILEFAKIHPGSSVNKNETTRILQVKKEYLKENMVAFFDDTLFVYDNGYILYIDVFSNDVFKIVDAREVIDPVGLYVKENTVYLYGDKNYMAINYFRDYKTVGTTYPSSDSKVIKRFITPYYHMTAVRENGTIDVYQDCKRYYSLAFNGNDVLDKAIPTSSDGKNLETVCVVCKDGYTSYIEVKTGKTGLLFNEIGGYILDSMLYQSNPEVFYFKSGHKVIKSPADINEPIEALQGVDKILFASGTSFVSLNKDGFVYINEEKHSEIVLPIVFVNEVESNLVVIDSVGHFITTPIKK